MTPLGSSLLFAALTIALIPGVTAASTVILFAIGQRVARWINPPENKP